VCLRPPGEGSQLPINEKSWQVRDHEQQRDRGAAVACRSNLLSSTQEPVRVRGQQRSQRSRHHDEHPDPATKDVVVRQQSVPRIAEDIVTGQELECERQPHPESADLPRLP
jgi:hypothetical protein